MQRAPPSSVKRHKPYARPMASSSKPGIQGSFYQAQNFTIQDSTFCDGSHHLENFMEKFAAKSIPGAAFDSSERDPPPRCHPGTRLAIVERTVRFFANRECSERLLWLVGSAGVGKTAIMQTLAEVSHTPDFILGASLFFSVNGRDNGLKAIVTLAYQLAVKSESYRNFIQSELARDPTLLDKGLAPQFEKFILEPFVLRGISPEVHERFLILIDGLDECNNPDTQCAILELISSFCVEYPTAPLVWVIASRPEPHIARFLFPHNSTPRCTKEEIEVDDNQSCKDVERYLRNGLEKIRAKYPALDPFPRWPAEYDFLKIATAAGGLFAFGKTVVDYIDDPSYANPASQLEDVLEVIDKIRSQTSGEGKRHPMAGLDALYSRIISKIPRDTLNITKRLLLYTISPLKNPPKFKVCHDWLGISLPVGYGALHHLHSALNIPSMLISSDAVLKFRHKSFRDYLVDFERSGMFRNLDDEAYELHLQCATRILDGVFEAQKNQAPIPRIQQSRCNDALDFVTRSIKDRRLFSGTDIPPVLRLVDILSTYHFPYNLLEFASAIFDKGISPKLKQLNVLQEMSIGTLSMENIPIVSKYTRVLCRSQPPDPRPKRWVCSYPTRQENAEDPLLDKYFWNPDINCSCIFRARQEMEARKTCSPGDIATTFTDGTGNYGWVHYTFPDSKHPSTTWEFILPYNPKPTVATVEYV